MFSFDMYHLFSRTYHWPSCIETLFKYKVLKGVKISISHGIFFVECFYKLLCCHIYIYFDFVGAPFPGNFKEVVKTIFKRLFRVYAHIYHSHFQKIVSLKEEAHLNTCFKHFILFTNVRVIPFLFSFSIWLYIILVFSNLVNILLCLLMKICRSSG